MKVSEWGLPPTGTSGRRRDPWSSVTATLAKGEVLIVRVLAGWAFHCRSKYPRDPWQKLSAIESNWLQFEAPRDGESKASASPHFAMTTIFVDKSIKVGDQLGRSDNFGTTIVTTAPRGWINRRSGKINAKGGNTYAFVATPSH